MAVPYSFFWLSIKITLHYNRMNLSVLSLLNLGAVPSAMTLKRLEKIQASIEVTLEREAVTMDNLQPGTSERDAVTKRTRNPKDVDKGQKAGSSGDGNPKDPLLSLAANSAVDSPMDAKGGESVTEESHSSGDSSDHASPDTPVLDRRPVKKRLVEETEALTVSDVLLMCDLFYLPFEYGPRAVHLLKSAHWLIKNLKQVENAPYPSQVYYSDMSRWFGFCLFSKFLMFHFVIVIQSKLETLRIIFYGTLV